MMNIRIYIYSVTIILNFKKPNYSTVWIGMTCLTSLHIYFKIPSYKYLCIIIVFVTVILALKSSTLKILKTIITIIITSVLKINLQTLLDDFCENMFHAKYLKL